MDINKARRRSSRATTWLVRGDEEWGIDQQQGMYIKRPLVYIKNWLMAVECCLSKYRTANRDCLSPCVWEISHPATQTYLCIFLLFSLCPFRRDVLTFSERVPPNLYSRNRYTFPVPILCTLSLNTSFSFCRFPSPFLSPTEPFRMKCSAYHSLCLHAIAIGTLRKYV